MKKKIIKGKKISLKEQLSQAKKQIAECEERLDRKVIEARNLINELFQSRMEASGLKTILSVEREVKTKALEKSTELSAEVKCLTDKVNYYKPRSENTVALFAILATKLTPSEFVAFKNELNQEVYPARRFEEAPMGLRDVFRKSFND